MPKERKKVLCMDAQRHAEYYGVQQTFDELYAKSKAGEVFNGLMELVLSPDNIMLAYRNIKTNTGSYTAGTDKQNIGDIGRLPPAEVIGKVRKIVTGSEHGYHPKPVRRKDIPKPNGKTRPLGIPCIWDRLVQQCIKQILEPICEAKFSNNSYGFRPNRSVEHAVSRTYSLLQRAHLHYVLEFDIKGFFDNVNHSKLIRQLWALGIQDKQLLFVIKRILKAPIRMPDGSTVYPTKGTPQGGIISPLLANVVLNELDHWVDVKVMDCKTWDEMVAFMKSVSPKDGVGVMAYTLSKRAMNYYTSLKAVELGKRGIRVNALLPGSTDTGMKKEFEKMAGGQDNLVKENGGAGRLATPQEMADPLLFLNSGMAAFVSGLLLIADMGHNCEKTLGFCKNQLDVPAALKLYNTKFFQNKLKTNQ